MWKLLGWQWVQFRQAKHPVFWVCDEGCKSGCGAELATYSHCNVPNSSCNGSESISNGHSTQKAEYKLVSRPLHAILHKRRDA